MHQQRFTYRGQLLVAGVEVVALGEKKIAVLIKLYKPVTVPINTVSDFGVEIEEITRRCLRNLRVLRFDEDKPHLVRWLNPQVRIPRRGHLENHTFVLRPPAQVIKQGQRPELELITVTADVKREGFFVHIKRLHRSWCRRIRFARLTKKKWPNPQIQKHSRLGEEKF